MGVKRPPAITDDRDSHPGWPIKSVLSSAGSDLLDALSPSEWAPHSYVNSTAKTRTFL